MPRARLRERLENCANDVLITFAMRERTDHIAALSGPLGVGVILGLIGPFGTFDLLSPLPRTAYWLAVVSANWLLSDVIVRRVDALVGDRLPLPQLLVPLCGAVATAFPATGIVALANGLSGIGWPESVPVLFSQVLLLLAAIALPVYTWEGMREQMESKLDPAATDTPKPRAAREEPPQHVGMSLFTKRLPGPLEGRLLCLEMQDHYLVVHHSGGSMMILCRMEDAARELAGLGKRVHRSWWVAAHAVAGSQREGQRMYLRLADDRRIPVGRSYKTDLKQAGWL